MRITASPAALFRAPIGRCVRGRRFLLGFPTAELQVIIGWGALEPDDARAFADALRGQHRGLPRHASLADLHRVQHIGPEALGIIADAMLELAPVNAGITRRGAVVRPPGVAGMAVAGFWQLVDAGYPTRVFTDAAAALRWLGHPPRQIRADLAAWDEVADPTAGALAEQVRAVLTQAPTLSLAAVARRIGAAPRTVQRRLGDDGTSFRREADRARMAAARELLRDPTRSIKEVAARVGMTSTGFTTCFRRATGQAPTAWRADHAAPTAP